MAHSGETRVGVVPYGIRPSHKIGMTRRLTKQNRHEDGTYAPDALSKEPHCLLSVDTSERFNGYSEVCFPAATGRTLVNQMQYFSM